MTFPECYSHYSEDCFCWTESYPLGQWSFILAFLGFLYLNACLVCRFSLFYCTAVYLASCGFSPFWSFWSTLMLSSLLRHLLHCFISTVSCTLKESRISLSYIFGTINLFLEQNYTQEFCLLFLLGCQHRGWHVRVGAWGFMWNLSWCHTKLSFW